MKTKLIWLVLFSAALYQCNSRETKLEYFPSGNIKAKVEVKDKVKDGTAVLYFPNGQVQAIHSYKNDSLCGVSSYFSDNGLLSKKVSYKNSIRNGPFDIYHDNGNIAEVGTYILGSKRGKVISYYREDSAKIHYETYLISVNNQEFTYYRNIYGRNGELQKVIRPLDVRIPKDSVSLSEAIVVKVKLSSDVNCDSCAILVGQFDPLFNLVGEIDTVHLVNKAAEFTFRPSNIGKQFIRGKWSAISKEEDADSIYQYNTFGFFEEQVIIY